MIDIQISKEISNLINTELLSISNSDVYNLLDKEIKVADLNQIFKSLLQNKSQLKNVGIDLPLSFGDYHSAINKTMVVALDPKRNDKSNAIHNKKTPVEISIGSIFSLHTEEGKNTGKNCYWEFVSHLTNSSFVYLTDIYKIYYESKDSLGQKLLSNKDSDFTEKNKPAYEKNISILKAEIKIINPNRIITLGKDARESVIKIISNKINQGFGKNYKFAINFAEKNHYQKIIFLHGDNQYPCNKVDIIKKELNYFSLSYGSRRINIKNMFKNMPLPRFIANVILTYVINIFLRNNATEYFSGFRGIKINSLKKINYKKLSDNWIIEQQIHFEFIKKGFKISEIAINTIYEKSQKSMVPPFNYVLDVIKNMIKYALFK